jgi:hypothetical protein
VEHNRVLEVAVNARPELFSRLTRALARQSSPSLPDRLCAAFAEIVGGSGAAVSLGFSATDRHLLCASDDTIEWIESLQDVLREGPSLDAYRLRQTVSLEAATNPRESWPLLWDALSERAPVPGIHAYVMEPGSSRIGVITTYVDPAESLSVSPREAAFLADALGVAILGEMRDSDFADEKWAVRDRIAQATGMVVAQLRLPANDALSVLRARAFVEDATLADVSRRVVARELRFTSGDEGTA